MLNFIYVVLLLGSGGVSLAASDYSPFVFALGLIGLIALLRGPKYAKFD